MSENHNIPDHLIPSEETVIAADEDEKELNEKLDTPKWVYTEEPDDGLCPYCGCEYESASYASRVTDSTKGVCPYPVREYCDFIVKFIHSHHRDMHGRINGVKCFCGPAHEETFVTYPCMPDYDIKRF